MFFTMRPLLLQSEKRAPQSLIFGLFISTFFRYDSACLRHESIDAALALQRMMVAFKTRIRRKKDALAQIPACTFGGYPAIVLRFTEE